MNTRRKSHPYKSTRPVRNHLKIKRKLTSNTTSNNNLKMGNLISNIWGKFFAMQRDLKILMVGLDAAGKTTILYQLRLGEQVTSIPTIGFNVETVQYKNICFNIWDIGGQERLRTLWQHYFESNDAIIYVVDSSDLGRIDNECKDELHRVIEADGNADVPLLVYANKQDMPGALNAKELTQRLDLHKVRNRDWQVQSSIATRGDGLYEGLDWLSTVMAKRPAKA